VGVNWPKKTRRKIPATDPGFESDERKEVIPPRYNKDSTLTAEVFPSENVRDFEPRSR
jgi:hypothetical protein